MKTSCKSLFFALVFFYLPLSLFAQSQQYIDWLERNVKDPSFPLILQKATAKLQSLPEIIALTEAVGSNELVAIPDRVWLWQRLGMISELQSNFVQARHAYLQAYELTADPQFLLAASLAAFELGDYAQVNKEIRVLLGSEVTQDAQILYVRMLEIEQQEEQAWELLQTVLEEEEGPALLYYAWEMARRQNRPAEEFAQKLRENFPRSPETRLLAEKGSLAQIPLPSRLLSPLYSQTLSIPLALPNAEEPALIPYGMQVGVFSSQENATSFSQDLRAQGFSMQTVAYQNAADTTLYRVIIQNTDRASTQSFIVRLREENIEGVLLTDSPIPKSDQP